ncbi:MAG: HEPN domain-containing protein [Prevotella sp.]|nr:HEPN domain-containing protein [Prevotella sp.]
MDSEDRKALIAYRQEKADLALDDAAFLTEAGRYGLAANRLYYALYYAASAILLSKGVVTKRHSGLMSQIHLHFVKTGILSPDEGALFKVMFSLRHEDDYEDFIEVERADIEEYTPRVTALVNKLKTLVEV